MAHTKLPLTTWFPAIHLICQAKTGSAARALKRDLSVSPPTVWLLHHRINNAATRQEGARMLGGTVQLDDAYRDGECAAGKPGPCSNIKTALVAAVSSAWHRDKAL